MPRQSQGADGVEESQPSSAPRGSFRCSLKEVKACISDKTTAFCSPKAKWVSVTKRKIAVAVDVAAMSV